MKVAVECRSPLLQRSLEMFLSGKLSSAKSCDILIRDVKCSDNDKCFYISQDEDADLIKPFSKSQLVLALESKYKKDDETVEERGLDFSILEKRIEALTQEYQSNILKAVRAFYEK